MGVTREMLKWIFDNIVPGETDPNKYVDADRVMDNYYSIRDMIAIVGATGDNATDNGSTATVGDIIVKTAEGETGLLDLNDYVEISDGTNKWRLKNTTANDNLVFDNTDLCKGTGPADYSTQAFRNLLEITIVKFRGMIGKDQVILTGTHSDKLTAGDIEISASDATKVGTSYEATKAIVDNVTTGAGASSKIAAGVVEKTALVKTGPYAIMEDDSPRNLSRGMFDNPIEANDILWGLRKTPALALDYGAETTIVRAGTYSQYFQSNGSAQGIEILLDMLFDMKLLAGKKVTLVVWLYSSEDDALDVGIWDDDDGYQVSNVEYTKDGWVKKSITFTVGTTATDVRGVVLSANATITNHYVDIAGIYIGETAFDPAAPSISASIVNHALNNRVYNYIPFSDLAGENSGKEPGHAWLNGSTSPPVGWDGTGDTTADDSNYYVAGRSWEIDLDAGEYFRHYIGISEVAGRLGALKEIIGKSVTFALWLKKSGANTEDLDLIVEEYVGSSWSEVASNSFAVNDYDIFSQVAVTGEINPNADFVRILIKNNGSATISAYIDALMFTQTAHPIGYTSLSPWQYVKFEFGLASSLADGMMLCQGITGEIPVGINCIAYGMTVTEQMSGTGTDSFYPKVGGVSKTDLQVDLGNGEDYESVHHDNGVQISSGDTLGVYCDAQEISGMGSDAFAVVHCLTWGI